MTADDVTPLLKGRVAEVRSSGLTGRPWLPRSLSLFLTLNALVQLFWPDDKMWYLVEIQALNLKTRAAK